MFEKKGKACESSDDRVTYIRVASLLCFPRIEFDMTNKRTRDQANVKEDVNISVLVDEIRAAKHDNSAIDKSIYIK